MLICLDMKWIIKVVKKLVISICMLFGFIWGSIACAVIAVLRNSSAKLQLKTVIGRAQGERQLHVHLFSRPSAVFKPKMGYVC